MTTETTVTGPPAETPLPPQEPVIAVIGLGYVGLPLAVAFGRRFETIGFDVSARRVAELRNGEDRTQEVSKHELLRAAKLQITHDPQEIAGADVYIVTVPTPIDEDRRPDLQALRSASRTVGAHLKPGNIVIYESTVYPGATEEECGPILSATSGLKVDKDFSLGYSPERINPGDTAHRLENILKVTSGSNPAAATYVDNLYRQIINAGTHLTSSIRVAEAAKVIENTQRDVNIALINELAVLFNTLGINTHEVLAAAGTKWNFLNFRPGLVGGHCIGVDPYYLTHKAQQVGHNPEVILAGRRINDHMGDYVADEVMRLMVHAGRPVGGSRVLILGLAFKENCPDLRNTKVVDVVNRLRENSVSVDVVDPWIDPREAKEHYGIELLNPQITPNGSYNAVVLAVAHTSFEPEYNSIRDWLSEPGVVYDVKGVLPPRVVDATL